MAMDLPIANQAPHPHADIRPMANNADQSNLVVQLIPGYGYDIARADSDAPPLSVNTVDTKIKTDCFKSIEMPEGWRVEERESSLGYQFTAKSPRFSDTTISAYSRGRSLNEDDAKSFNSALSGAENLKVPKLLYDSNWENNGTLDRNPTRRQAIVEQMKQLAGVFGRTQLGDNQFTNKNVPPHPQSPSFHIDRVEVQNVNGRPVISLEGWSPDKDGKPGNYFHGIFVPQRAEGSGLQVHEVFLQSRDKMQFMANKAPFKKTINSIVW